MMLGSADNFTGPDHESSVFFLPKDESVEHLGIWLGSDPAPPAKTHLRL